MKKVLIVDDDAIICDLLVDALSDEFRTEAVTDGLDAMSAFMREKPDVIICDFNMNMPQLHGVSVVDYILEKPENKTIKFVLISGYLSHEQLKRWKELIPRAVFFSKPFIINEVKAAIHELIDEEKPAKDSNPMRQP